MADAYDEFVDFAELTGYGREALDEANENEFTLSRWLPNQLIDDLKYRLESGPKGLLDVADFRAYNAEPTFGRREGISRIEGSLPPIGRQMTLDEYDQLILRKAEEKVRDLLLRDAERIAKVMGRRMELARGDALVNGSVTIGTEDNPENGLQLTVEYNRRDDHTVAAARVWTDAASLPLDELEAWFQRWRDTNGDDPGSFLINRAIVRALLRNPQVRDAINGEESAKRVKLEDLRGLFTDEGWPDIETYEARATVVQPKQGGGFERVTRRIIPQEKALILPAPGGSTTDEGGEIGATLWGVTVEASLAEYAIEDSEAPGIVVGSFIERKSPVRVDTVGAGIGLPVMADADLTMVATVLDDAA